MILRRLFATVSVAVLGLVPVWTSPAVAAVGVVSPGSGADPADSGAGDLELDLGAAVADLDLDLDLDRHLDGGLDTIPGQYVVEFVSDVGRQRSLPGIEAAGWSVLHRSEARGDASFGIDQPWVVLGADDPIVADLDRRLGELRADRDVVRVSPNHVRRLVQTDPPWGLDRIDQRSLPLSATFTPGGTGQGVRVYVIDDGIRREHADFGGRVTEGAHLSIFDGDSDPFCSTHGSHVAGTIGGTFSGVAKQVELIPVRVFDCGGSAPDAAVLAAMDWVRDDHRERGGGTAVVNMSFGGPPSTAIDAKAAQLDAEGLLVVTAIGNEGELRCGSPARASVSIGVAASTIDDTRAWFSNFGPCVDLFAPGAAIVSVDATNGSTSGFRSMNGTSMATPHVAGVAALLIEANPGWSPAQVRQRLLADATPGVITGAGLDTPDRLLWIPPDLTGGLSVGLVTTDLDRIVDSRIGLGVAGPLAADQTVVVPVLGRAGVPVDATAVALNVTAAEPAAVGFLSVTPCTSTGIPTTSNLNVEAGRTVANAVITPVAADGSVCVYTSVPTQLLVDVVGSFSEGFGALAPQRLLDTRPSGPVPAGSITPVRVAGRAGVPETVSTVVLNVTAVEPQAVGFLTVYPCDAPTPTASNVNFEAGGVVPNAVVVRASAAGDVCVFASATTDLLVDVSGTLDESFVGLVPDRFLETRGGPRRASGTVTRVEIAGRGDVPPDATAAVLNVTVVDPVEAGFASVFPCGAGWETFEPRTSSVNFPAGRNVANAVVTPLGSAGGTSPGAVCVYTSAPTHLLVDVAGAFR